MTAQPPLETSRDEPKSSQYRVGFFVTDSGGLCYWASSELLDLANLVADELQGQFWFRLLAEKDRKKAISLWESSIPHGKPFSFTGRASHGRGKEVRLLIECEVVPAQKERASYCVGVVIEAGPEATAEARYDRLQEALAKVDKTERERFNLAAALNVADTTINQLQSDLKRANEKSQTLTKRIDELGKNILRAEGELAQTCSAKFSLESQIVELKASHGRIVDDQQKALISVRNELEAKLVEKINEKRPIEEERAKLSQENERAQAKLKDQEQQLAALTERLKALEATLEREKTRALTTLQEREKEYTHSKAELDAQLLKMLGEASDLLTAKKTLSEKISTLSRALEKADENEKTLLGRIQTLELGLSSEKDAAKTQSAVIEKQKIAQDELAVEKKKNQELIARMSDLVEKLAVAEEEIQDGKKAIKAISRQTEESDSLKARFERERAEAQKQRDSLESELKVLREHQTRDSAELNLQRALTIDSQKALQGPTKAMSQVGKHLASLFQELFSFLHQLSLSGEHARSVAKLKTSADYIAKLTTTVVDALNLEHRQERLAHEKINLKRFIAQLTGVFDFKASQQDVSFSSDVSTEIPEAVYGDPARLEHALSTLLGNVLKLLPEQAAIALTIALQKKQAEVCHLDFAITCSGILDLTARQEICALAASTTVYASQNCDGLGFAMCRKILDLMGSKLDVSEDQEAIRMHFVLPLAMSEQRRDEAPAYPSGPEITRAAAEVPAPAPRLDASFPAAQPVSPEPQAVPKPAPPEKLAPRRLRVLLAEDNRINQNFITRVLKRHNHEVVLAVNGKEAFDKAQKDDYDLVLMDCQMPQVDGYQATRNIRSHQQSRAVRSTIIGMSAHLDMDGRERCISAGMDEYVSKPIQEERLIELIRQLFPDE